MLNILYYIYAGEVGSKSKLLSALLHVFTQPPLLYQDRAQGQFLADFNRLEFGFPSTQVAIPRLNSPVCSSIYL